MAEQVQSECHPRGGRSCRCGRGIISSYRYFEISL